MPELPEVETIVRELRPSLLGRRFGRVRLSHDDVLRGVSRRKLIASLNGAVVQEVTRRAKHAVLVLASGRSRRSDAAAFRHRAIPPSRLIIQPGMTGSLQVHRQPLTGEAAHYAVLRIPLDNGAELVYEDVRRLGTILLLNPAEWAAYDDAIGPEPLNGTFTATAFAATLKSSRQAIKKVLMDQRKLAGIGNIYANEALFAAGIDPSRAANRVRPDEAGRLLQEVRRILAAAISFNGTTIRDYRTGTGASGNFQFELMVYGREGQPCRVCGTRLAQTHEIDARTTVFCHRCQS